MLETAFAAQSKALVDALKRIQDLAESQQKTLDRIVTAQYERPIERVAQPVTASMPAFMLDGDSDDTEFLESVGVK